MKYPDKEAIVSAMVAYREVYGGVIPNFVVDQISERTGVARRTLRWWAAEQRKTERAKARQTAKIATGPAVQRKSGRAAFQLSEEHLIAVRSTLNLKEAHNLLWPEDKTKDDGWVSYPTFARAFKSLPPSIRDGILLGWDGMTKRQVYLSMAAPHKNHTWHLDHTQADVWVSIPGGQIIRPWISAVRDNATSMRLAATAYKGRPNEDSICDVLATASLTRTYDTEEGPVTVGGVPVQLVLGNGAEHFAEAVTRGLIMLGTVLSPSKAFYKHQNGPAESTFSGVNKQLLAALPGYTKGGDGDDGKPLICPSMPDKIDPDMVLTFEAFQKHLDAWLIKQNTTGRVHRLGNQPPIVAWRDDNTEVREVAPQTFRAMMLRSRTDRVVNAEGIRFRGIDYIAPELNYYREKGLTLRVGYLTRETRFIEVFDGDTWVCRAYNRLLLNENQRQAILRNRQRDLDLLKRVNAAANQERIHRQQSNPDAEYDCDDIDPTAQRAVAEALDNVTKMDAKRSSKQASADQVDKAQEPDVDDPTKPFAPPHIPRVDPTTPQRRKRQQAPSRAERDEQRRQEEIDQSHDRIAQRPGANLGGDE